MTTEIRIHITEKDLETLKEKKFLITQEKSGLENCVVIKLYKTVDEAIEAINNGE